MELVNSDDSKERNLRRQEEYLLAVKAFGGDVERARELVNRRRDEKRQQTMNIIDQMTRSMRDQSASVDVHKKKTAIQFWVPISTVVSTGIARAISPNFRRRSPLTSTDGQAGRLPA